MKIFLQNIKITDAYKIAEWKSNPDLSDLLMSEKRTFTVEESQTWIDNNTKDIAQKLKGIYILNEHSEHELLGVVRLMYIDYESLNAEFGIYIGDFSRQGLGVGAIAVDEILKIAFSELKLFKVYLKVNENNVKAIRLYKKKGFVMEGCLKEHYLKGEEFQDIIYMAIERNNFLNK
jgi:UDP-4-amino-4,6-dideoxy-N-acetyl-beta-L-altrosamine N-acetyltransferase